MDYLVFYKIGDQFKNKYIMLEDFIPYDFLEDFVVDEIYNAEGTRDIVLLDIVEIRDSKVNVDNI